MERDLRELLIGLYSDVELERFIADFYPDLQAEVNLRADRAQAVFGFVQLLMRHGSVNEGFFDRLQQARPGRVREIDAVRRAFRDRPVYASAAERALGERLEALYEARAVRQAAGDTSDELNAEIVDIRRQQRQGPQLVAGDRLEGRYRLLRPLGAGGFATVWAAFDAKHRRHVAVKVLHGQYASGGDRLSRFRRGARMMQALDHSNVVRVLNADGEDGGHQYFVMELLEGGDLWRAIVSQGLSVDAVLDIVESIASALAAAHHRDPPLVHRDVKPANILLTRSGVAKLTDFDLVRTADTWGGTRTGTLGSFVYAAPEALKKASDAGPAADVYGLAMTAVVGLTGREPDFAEKFSPDSLLVEISAPAGLVDLLRRSLQTNPDDRPADCGRFLSALRSVRTAEAAEPASSDQPQTPASIAVAADGSPRVYDAELAVLERFLSGRRLHFRRDEIESCRMAILGGDPLLVEGPSGTGKTLLVNALAEFFLADADRLVKTHNYGSFTSSMLDFEGDSRVAQTVGQGRDGDDRYWLFIDHLNEGDVDPIHPLLDLLERRTTPPQVLPAGPALGARRLVISEGFRLICASNPSRVQGRDPLASVRSRFRVVRLRHPSPETVRSIVSAWASSRLSASDLEALAELFITVNEHSLDHAFLGASSVAQIVGELNFAYPREYSVFVEALDAVLVRRMVPLLGGFTPDLLRALVADALGSLPRTRSAVLGMIGD